MIIIYGNSTEDWVKHTLLESRKIIANREQPLEALVVFEGPPEPKDPLSIKISNMQILNSQHEFNESKLTEFVERLKKGGA